MRRLAIALAAVMTILAGTTAYYARELSRLRIEGPARQAAAIALPSETPARVEVVAASPATGATPTPGKPDAPSYRLQPHDLKFLADMQDPAGRRDRVDRQKSSIRRDSPYLAEYLGLDKSEFEAFLEIVASTKVAQREQTLRCQQRPGCRDFLTDEARREGLSQALAPEFGVGKAARYEHYLLTSDERLYVSRMRGQLSDRERLGDAGAESLIDALADERVRIRNEIEARSLIPGMTLDGVPFVLYQGTDVTTLMEQADEYFRRMRVRAGPLLSPGQLAAYDRVQEERLRRLPYQLRSVFPVPDGATP